jgi:hypothetical protein
VTEATTIADRRRPQAGQSTTSLRVFITNSPVMGVRR